MKKAKLEQASLLSDQEQASADEVNGGVQPKATLPDTQPAAEKAKSKTPAPPAHEYFEEWKVEIKARKAEKLKMLRPCVKITEEQADILNEGVLYGNNALAVMYFKPE